MLTVLSTQGSPGASTTALHLAAHWASTGQEVLLIEADPAGGSMSHSLGIQFTPGSASFVAAGLPVLSSHLIDHAQDVLFENLHVMPAPASPTGARGILDTFAEHAHALRAISENEMAVIIDGGRITSESAASRLTTDATGVVAVCRNNHKLPSLELLDGVLAAEPGDDRPRGFAVSVGESPMDPDEWYEFHRLTYLRRDRADGRRGHRPRRLSQPRQAQVEEVAGQPRAGGRGAVSARAPADVRIPPQAARRSRSPGRRGSRGERRSDPAGDPGAGCSGSDPGAADGPAPDPSSGPGQSHYLPPGPQAQPGTGQSHYLPPAAPWGYPQAPPEQLRPSTTGPTASRCPTPTRRRSTPHTPTSRRRPTATSTATSSRCQAPTRPTRPGIPFTPTSSRRPPSHPRTPTTNSPRLPTRITRRLRTTTSPLHRITTPLRRPITNRPRLSRRLRRHRHRSRRKTRKPTHRSHTRTHRTNRRHPTPPAHAPQSQELQAAPPTQGPPAAESPTTSGTPPADESETAPVPTIAPTGSFRDWAAKLHGVDADDDTAIHGGG